MIQTTDHETWEEYFGRVSSRMAETEGQARKLVQLQLIARSAESHFQRLDMALRRRELARKHGNRVGVEYENEVILALLYEVLDTVYVTIALLDPDTLDIQASQFGEGISGEMAHYVVDLLHALNRYSTKALKLADELGVGPLDFSTPVAEKEGITYFQFPHWNEFKSENLRDSFYGYFAEAQKNVRKRMQQVPRVWKAQSVRDYLERSHHYPALLQAIDLLLQAELGG